MLLLLFGVTSIVHAGDSVGFEDKQYLQTSEIYTGTIVSINQLPDNPSDAGKDYYFELEIAEIHKTRTAPRIGDTVKVRFIRGAIIITGNKPMMAQIGDVVKIYANTSRRHPGFLNLKYGGDSVYILKGDQPTDMETFLALFGVERSNVYVGEILKVVGVLLGALLFAGFIIRTFKIHKR